MHYLHKHNRFLNFGIKERMMNKICLFIILVFLCFTSALSKDFLDKKESNMLVSSENMALELAEIYIKKRIWKYRFNKSKTIPYY